MSDDNATFATAGSTSIEMPNLKVEKILEKKLHSDGRVSIS